MSDHAAYMRNWRRLHGMIKGRAHDLLPDEAEFERRGKQLAALMMLPVPNLPWPKDLFGNNATIATLMMQVPKTDDICAWEGCNRPHRNNHPMTIPSQYGHGFSVKYFCVDAHKSAHVKKYGRT